MLDEAGLAKLATIEAEQARLRELVAGVDPADLARRPPNGGWSVVEHVRHLLFAEQSHLGRGGPMKRPWSALALPPHNMQPARQFAALDMARTYEAAEVLEVWEAEHAAIRELLEARKLPAGKALDRNLRHLRAHIRVVERLLRPRA
jgi:uncharacterized damage-inducible protein DinB